MKYFFVARLYGLKTNRTLNRGIKVIDNLRISTSKDRLDKKCDMFFQSFVGKLDYDDLYNGPYLYAEGNYEPDQKNDERKRLELLDYFLKLGLTVSSALWLIKDNSITTENGFIYVFNENNSEEEISVSSNVRTSHFSTSFGQRVDTEYTYDEIIEGLNIHRHFFDDNSANLNNSESANIVTTKANRIERFVYFLQSARSEVFLPNKISMYCTTLETLLSTDNQEISHKISERMAKLIGRDLNTREAIYKFIKVAYSIRSNNVHGDKLPKKYRTIEKQVQVANDLDNYIRTLYKHILFNEELMNIYIKDDSNNLGQYLNKLVLS